jgi:hypothetical protein
VLLLRDSVSGLLYPPVVVAEEGSATGWGHKVAPQLRDQVRAELEALVRGVLDAPSGVEAEQALAQLRLHP